MRKSFFLTAILVAGALGTLLVMAFNQFQRYGGHEEIISRTEKLIFRYATIREQIIGSIVEGRTGELAQVSGAVEDLHAAIIQTLDTELIPAEYRFSFMQQLDLPGLVLLLRKSSGQVPDGSIVRLINEETRVIGERFMLLERFILGHAKQKLVDFQLVVIGTLALIVFLVTTLLLVTYRLLILPVADMSRQMDDVLHGRQQMISDNAGWDVVSDIADRINLLLADTEQRSLFAQRTAVMLDSFLHAAQRIVESKEPVGMYMAVCRALLQNPDYILVWVGIEGEEGTIIPVAADGSSTMTGEECQECFGALLAAQEGEKDPVRQAYASGKGVTAEDILAGSPKGPFKNTPMAEGQVDSISLPLNQAGTTTGVLTVYHMSRESIFPHETDMLQGITSLMGVWLQILTAGYSLGEGPAAVRLELAQMIYFTAIGQYAGTMGHEIIDLSNGVINYAQVMSDEIRGQQNVEWKKMLARIIEAGEKVAGVVEPLLIAEEDTEHPGELGAVRTVVDDVLRLTAHTMHRNGLQVNGDVAPETMQCRTQPLRLMLLTALHQVVGIVRRYMHMSSGGQELHLSVVSLDGQEEQSMIRIRITLPEAERAAGELEDMPDMLPELWLCGELAGKLGGTMRFSAAEAGSMLLEVTLPC